MKKDKKLQLIGAAACLFLPMASGAHAQEGAGPPQPSPGELVFMNLGQAGLIAEMNDYEDFGTIQSRTGQSRAQIAAARNTGVMTGYRDSASIGVLPFDVFYALPSSNGKSFIKVGGVGNYNAGDRNQTQLKVQNARLEVAYFSAPTRNTLIGLGAVVEHSHVDMVHNDGAINSLGFGVRGDLVQKFDGHWGAVVRAEYLWSEGKTRIPLGNGIQYRYDQTAGRFYGQAAIIGSFTTQDIGFIPKGWAFHPSVRAIYQHNRFDDARDSFGNTVTGSVGTHDAYATISGNLRLESMNLRPGHLAPYVQIGMEQEVQNDLDLFVKDPTFFHPVIGTSFNVGGGAMFHLEYGRHDGLKGERRDQALTLHFGMVL